MPATQFNYSSKPKGEQKSLTVAVIQAKCSSPVAAPMMLFPFAAAANNSGHFNRYEPQFSKSMTSSIESILKNKGIKIYNSYPSQDDVTFTDKKKVSLILEIKCAPMVTEQVEPKMAPIVGQIGEKGSVSISGNIKLSFIEPMTKEAILFKEISISDVLGANYLKQFDGDKGIAESSLVELLNSSFALLMSSIDSKIDGDELEQTSKDVKELKGKKVY